MLQAKCSPLRSLEYKSQERRWVRLGGGGGEGGRYTAAATAVQHAAAVQCPVHASFRSGSR